MLIIRKIKINFNTTYELEIINFWQIKYEY